MAGTGAGGRLPGVARNAVVDVAAVFSLGRPRVELLFRLRHLVARRKHEPFLCKWENCNLKFQVLEVQ